MATIHNRYKCTPFYSGCQHRYRAIHSNRRNTLMTNVQATWNVMAETRFRLSAKRTSLFKSAGASVQSTTGSRGVRISGSNAGYTMFRGSVKGTGYPLHSPVFPLHFSSRASPCAITFQLDSTTGGLLLYLKLNDIICEHNDLNYAANDESLLWFFNMNYNLLTNVWTPLPEANTFNWHFLMWRHKVVSYGQMLLATLVYLSNKMYCILSCSLLLV